MSIYATFFDIEDERQVQASLKASGIGGGVIMDDGLVEDLDTLPADMLDAPIKYQGSHILPNESDERAGSVSLAYIPSHITRDGRHDNPEDGKPWPYLRVDVQEDFTSNGSTVILTRDQVIRFRDALTGWIESEGWI